MFGGFNNNQNALIRHPESLDDEGISHTRLISHFSLGDKRSLGEVPRLRSGSR